VRIIFAGDASSKLESYANDAYRETEASVTSPGQVQSSETALQVDSQLKQRNISDVSEVFRPPSPETKTLSDIMLEKYDRKTRSLRSEEDLSDIDFNEIDSVANEKPIDSVINKEPTNRTQNNKEIVSIDKKTDLNIEATPAEAGGAPDKTAQLHDDTDGCTISPTKSQQQSSQTHKSTGNKN